MSIASISYSSLKDASKEAEDVAKKLDKYADELYSDVYKKLNKYDGSWNSNVSTASSKINSKISELRSEQSKYKAYARDLTDLRDECKEVDKAVKSKVSSLTASFKEAHGIRNSKIVNTISYICTSAKNKTAAGRWLGSKSDDLKSGAKYIKASIKEWYNYEGGKELIKGLLTVVLEVAIAVAGAVVAVLTFIAGTLTFGAVLVLAAALVGAAIALQNAWSNWENEKAAYRARQNGDPATGKRLSALDSYTDYLRSSFVFGEDGQTYHYNKVFNGIANVIDVTGVVCTVITVINSCGKLLSNGFKWATGDANATWKNLFQKDGLTKLFSGIKTNLGNGLKDLGKAISMRDLKFFKEALLNFGSDFLTNLKGEFLDTSTFKKGLSSIKNILSVTKSIVNGGLTFKTIMEKVVLPGFGVAHVPGGDDMIVLDDFYSIYDDIKEKICGSSVFTPDLINTDVLDKISTISCVDISIPDIYVPQVSINLAAA